MRRKCSWCETPLTWKERLTEAVFCKDCRSLQIKARVLPRRKPMVVLPEYSFAEPAILEYRRERLAIFLQRELGKTTLRTEREAILEMGAALLPSAYVEYITTALAA
jgi:hypothetical protein